MIVALVIAAKLLVNFTAEPNINYMFFVPFALCVWTLFIKNKSFYAGLLTMSGVGALYLFLTNSFDWHIIVEQGFWMDIGAVLTFLIVYLYRHVGIRMY